MVPKIVNEYKIRKKNKIRTIVAPQEHYKTLLQHINIFLMKKLPVHPISYGWTKGRNAYQIVYDIQSYPIIAKTDIKDYFGSIDLTRLRSYLLEIYSTKVVDKIMEYCTYKNKIPQGFPTSPTLANYYRYRLDNKLQKLATENNVVCYVYGDDIIIAGNYIDSSVVDKFIKTITNYGLRVNYRKTKIMTKKHRQEVLGFILNKTVNIPKNIYESLYSSVRKKNKIVYSSPTLIGKILMFKKVNTHKYYLLLNQIDRLKQIDFIASNNRRSQ